MMMSRFNRNLTNEFRALYCALLILGIALAVTPPVYAQDSSATSLTTADRATYADLVSLSERSEFVIRAQIRRQTTLEANRAPGLEAGFARLYVEARTIALIAGERSIGESLVYLVDVPLDAKGKVPKLRKREMVLFANLVPGRAPTRSGVEIQLMGRNAQLDYSPDFEARLRPVLSSLVAEDVPPRIEGISDALSVPGTLAGESETQVFVATADRSPLSLTVLRRPGQAPVWGASWGEIIDSAARPPQPGTLRWYRLACSLPARLPSSANLARDPAARRLAESDYAFVIEQLGECKREITEAA